MTGQEKDKTKVTKSGQGMVETEVTMTQMVTGQRKDETEVIVTDGDRTRKG